MKDNFIKYIIEGGEKRAHLNDNDCKSESLIFSSVGDNWFCKILGRETMLGFIDKGLAEFFMRNIIDQLNEGVTIGNVKIEIPKFVKTYEISGKEYRIKS